MIKGRSARTHSLYLSFISIILIGLIFAVGAYFSTRLVSEYAINNYYMKDDRRAAREEGYHAALQSYVDSKELTSEDMKEIEKWAKDNRYVYLLIYRDEELLFSPEIEEGENEYPIIGEITTTPNRDELVEAAKKNGLKELKMSDGLLFASIAEFTEYFYYDLSTILSITLAVLVLVLFIIFYLNKIITRIKRLESDVAIVSRGDMSHKISRNGNDEIATLSENVENMRNSILDNLRKEREARDANNALITSISHDIRTPLTILLGYIDIMKSRGSSDPEMQSYVEAAESTAMRLKQLSDDMFKYSLAFGDEEIPFKLEEYNAKMLLEQMIYEHVLLLKDKGYRVVLENLDNAVKDDRVIHTDAPNLMRIIDNLFSNITKYADICAPVTISAKLSGDTLILDFQNKISDKKPETESNGIGLKTCVRLSSIVAESFEYKSVGTSFTARLTLKATKPKSTK